MHGLGKLVEPGKRVLWVSSCGGHLAELKKMANMYSNVSIDSAWATFDTPQSRSMLEGEKVYYVPRVGTRDLLGTLQMVGTAYKILRDGSFDYVISTGAAVAVAFLPLASIMGAEALYVESLTRTQGASTTGKILQHFAAVRTFAQYESWSDSRWQYVGSVLDDWQFQPRQTRPVKRVLVSLGTIQPYRFDRAVDAVVESLPAGASVTWQLGATSRADLPGAMYKELAWDDMGRLIRESDLFVCHAGVGSVLQALENGALPVLAVRSADRNEHVDEHQSYFAHEMVRRGLATLLDLSSPGRAPQAVVKLDPNKGSRMLSSIRFGLQGHRRIHGRTLRRTEHPARTVRQQGTPQRHLQ